MRVEVLVPKEDRAVIVETARRFREARRPLSDEGRGRTVGRLAAVRMFPG